MSVARRLGLAFLGVLVGTIIGGVAGLLAGLGYTTLASTSSFEGYSGYVVVLSILAGILIGMASGTLLGLRRGAA